MPTDSTAILSSIHQVVLLHKVRCYIGLSQDMTHYTNGLKAEYLHPSQELKSASASSENLSQ